MIKRSLLALAASGLVCACSSSDDSTPTNTGDAGAVPTTDSAMTDQQFSAQVATAMVSSLNTDLQALVDATTALQVAAPDAPWTDGVANDSATDKAAWTKMTTAWINARHAYEHVEGATAPIYPNIDLSIDGRVEDFGPVNGGSGGSGALTATSDMFGDQGMTGLHAAERILWAAQTPAAVETYETSLGYVPAQSFPTTQAQADEFKNKLCTKMVSDAKSLLAGWTAANINVAEAYGGLRDLMNEQKEKVTKAGLHEEESRYSQRTMDDLRENLSGTAKIYAVFQPWLTSKSGGAAIDTRIQAGFTGLNTLYTSSEYAGAAFPPPPADWSDIAPTTTDLATTFGKLYSAVQAQVDPNTTTSIVAQMNDAATLLGITQ